MQPPVYKKTKSYKPKRISLIFEIAFFLFAIIFFIAMLLYGKDFFRFLKEKKIERDLKYFYEIAINYKNKYRYFPGDDPFAELKCQSSMYIANGNGSGYIGDNKNIDEEEQAIRHLRCVKLLEGNVDENIITFPRNSYNGEIKYTYIKYKNKKHNVIKFYKLPLEVIKDIDKRLDNNDLDTGKIILIKEEKNKKVLNVLVYFIS